MKQWGGAGAPGVAILRTFCPHREIIFFCEEQGAKRAAAERPYVMAEEVEECPVLAVRGRLVPPPARECGVGTGPAYDKAEDLIRRMRADLCGPEASRQHQQIVR